jgi:hypothetical protein
MIDVMKFQKPHSIAAMVIRNCGLLAKVLSKMRHKRRIHHARGGWGDIQLHSGPWQL